MSYYHSGKRSWRRYGLFSKRFSDFQRLRAQPGREQSTSHYPSAQTQLSSTPRPSHSKAAKWAGIELEERHRGDPRVIQGMENWTDGGDPAARSSGAVWDYRRCLMAKVIKEELFIVSQYEKWDLCPPCLWACILQGLLMRSCHLGSSLSFFYWDGKERTARTVQLNSSALKFLLQINHSLQPRDSHKIQLLIPKFWLLTSYTSGWAKEQPNTRGSPLSRQILFWHGSHRWLNSCKVKWDELCRGRGIGQNVRGGKLTF